MQTDNKFMDDLAKLAAGAVGTIHGVKGEMESMVRQKLGAWLADLDLVTREEFEVVREMAEKARLDNERLAKEMAALEKRLGAPSSAGKPAVKRSSKTKIVKAPAVAGNGGKE